MDRAPDRHRCQLLFVTTPPWPPNLKFAGGNAPWYPIQNWEPDNPIGVWVPCMPNPPKWSTQSLVWTFNPTQNPFLEQCPFLGFFPILGLRGNDSQRFHLVNICILNNYKTSFSLARVLKSLSPFESSLMFKSLYCLIIPLEETAAGLPMNGQSFKVGTGHSVCRATRPVTKPPRLGSATINPQPTQNHR